MNSKVQFVSSDQSMRLTIVCAQGKSGINLKATVKGIGKGGPRALTGARHSFSDAKEAQKAFDRVVAESKAKGWLPVSVRSKNAFVDIPEPPKDVKKGSQAPVSEKNKNTKAA